MKKNNKTNKIIILSIIGLILIVSLIIFILNYTKDSSSFSILEKNWLNNHKSNVIDVSVYNDIPVFIDSRADVYDPQFNGWEDDIFRDFINLTNACNDYEEKFEHYGITHLLIYRNSTLDKVLRLDTNYNELYKDDNFILYQRNVEK